MYHSLEIFLFFTLLEAPLERIADIPLAASFFSATFKYFIILVEYNLKQVKVSLLDMMKPIS